MRNRLRRLQRAARGDLDWLELRDGSRFYFAPMDAYKVLFFERMDWIRALGSEAGVPDMSEGPHEPPREQAEAPPEPSELRKALAKATPESLARFEERYGPADPECGVMHEDGSVTLRRVNLDGSVDIRVEEGEEAEELRQEARGGTRW